MSKHWTPKELMYDLVAVESESFTAGEIRMAKHIYERIREQVYWQEHPALCGLYDGGDVLGRRLVWALRRGTTERTVILTGHFDCVEIRNYGALQPWALAPDRLMEEMRGMDFGPEAGAVKADLLSGDWCFGRGTADMKGGLACALCELFDHAEEKRSPEVNLLFVAVHDEEHQAEGIMQAAGLLRDLKERYGLRYEILLNPEPTGRDRADAYTYVDGSIGKILPGIVVKGDAIHVANITSGLTSTLIAAKIGEKIELNTGLRCAEFGAVTPPPAVLCLRDCKEEYNVSAPKFTEMYCHIPLTKNRSADEAEKALLALCREAAAEAAEKLTRARTCEAEEKGQPAPAAVPVPPVYTGGELEAVCMAQDPAYGEAKAAFLREQTEEVLAGRKLVQQAGLDILKWMIERSRVTGPLVVTGLLPPYVPPVNNHYMPGFDREGMIGCAETLLRERFGRSLIEEPYSMGLSDNSYTGCSDVTEDIKTMEKMVVPEALYRIPFEEIGEIAVPSVLIGPWGKDYHTWAERVYLPDLEEVTPAVLRELIRRVAERGAAANE